MGGAMGQGKIDDARANLGPKARAVEDAVMADLGLHIVDALVVGDVDAQMLRGLGLADAGNVVVLAFDGQQRGPPDLGQVDPLAAMHHLALRQRVLDEDLVDGLQVELGGQVHDRVVFVVELAVLVGGVAVILDQMPEELLVGRHVPIEIH